MFRIANPDTSRNVIAVSNKQGTEQFAMLNTVQAQRRDAPKDSELRFIETATGAPPAVGTYWYMGERTGYEFIYTKDQLAALNRSVQPASEVTVTENVPPIENPATSPDVVDGNGVPSVEETHEAQVAQAQQPVQPAPAQPPASQPAQPETGSARERLPQTASPLALLLLSGLATAGFGVKLLRKS